MITYLRGTLISMGEEDITLEVGGVGVRLNLSSYERAQLTDEELSEEIILNTHLALTTSGNQISVMLAGFLNQETYHLFTKLVTVPGLGPRAALQAISQPPTELIKAINDGDVETLKRLPGIGAAKARQIISSLAGKVVLPEEAEARASAATLEPPWDDVWSALEKFGHKRTEIEGMISKARKELPEAESVEEILAHIYRRE